MSVPPDMMTGNMGMPTNTGTSPSGGGGLPSWLAPLISTGGNLASLINSIQLQNTAGQNLSQSNPFGAFRPLYGQQLLQLMQNPGSVTSLPGYEFQLSQGAAALDRSAAAPGGVGFGSGAEGAQLEQFGQGLAASFYDRQIQTLAQLAGSSIAPANAAQMLTAAGGAAGGVGSSIAGLTNSTLGLLGKLFPGSSSTSGADLNSLLSFNTSVPGVDTGAITSTGDLGNLNDMTGGTGQYVTDTGGGGGLDLSGLFSGPSAAGGGAATAGSTAGGFNSLLQGAGAGGDIFGIYGGLEKGGPSGYAQAGLDAYKLYNNPVAQSLYSGATGATAVPGISAADWSSALTSVDTGTQAALSTDAASIGLTEETTAAGATAEAGAGAGAAAGAGGAAAGELGVGATLGIAALAFAPVLYGMSQPAFTLNQDYYSRVNAALAQGLAPGSPGFAVLNQASLNPGTITLEEWDMLGKYGITPSNVQAMFKQYAQLPFTGSGVGGKAGPAQV